MRSTLFFLAALPLALAAPRRLPAVNAARQASCDVSGLSQPASTLPAPTSGLQLVLVALGSGTQNYTCANATAQATPTAIGAMAQLYNASCEAVTASGGDVSVQSVEQSPSIGEHFFFDTTTPEFNIPSLGTTLLKKTAADSTTPGSANVAWLKLDAQTTGTTSTVKEIYRFRTSGGVAPSTCEGQKSLVTVSYTAQYWVYASA